MLSNELIYLVSLKKISEIQKRKITEVLIMLEFHKLSALTAF
jgi:hypothetical protein